MYERIRKLCEEKGKTVAGLERELGYVRGTIARFDKHSPSADRLKEVADALDTTVDELMRGE